MTAGPGQYDALRDPAVLVKVTHARQALRAFLDALDHLEEEQALGVHSAQRLLNSLRATRLDADLVWQDFRNHFDLLEDGFSWLPDEAWQAQPSEGNV